MAAPSVPRIVRLSSGVSWDGDLTPGATEQQERYATRVQSTLLALIEAHPDRSAWLTEGTAIRDSLINIVDPAMPCSGVPVAFLPLARRTAAC